MELLVFGAGSIGSLLGGLLSREHEVTLLGRDPHMRQIETEGLEITGLANERVYPSTTTDLEGVTADIALLTVKSYDTEAAAMELAELDLEAVCSVQNGLGNVEVLAEALSCPILGGSTTYGAYLEAPGQVRMTGDGTVTIGSFREGGDKVDTIVELFESAGLTAISTDDIRQTLWEKVAVNAAINPVTALTRQPNGAVATDPLYTVAVSAADEAVAVATANGIDLEKTEIRKTVRTVAEATAENRSSMLQDVVNEQQTEIGAINEAIVERSETIDVPVNETLAALIKGLSSKLA